MPRITDALRRAAYSALERPVHKPADVSAGEREVIVQMALGLISAYGLTEASVMLAELGLTGDEVRGFALAGRDEIIRIRAAMASQNTWATDLPQTEC